MFSIVCVVYKLSCLNMYRQQICHDATVLSVTPLSAPLSGLSRSQAFVSVPRAIKSYLCLNLAQTSVGTCVPSIIVS